MSKSSDGSGLDSLCRGWKVSSPSELPPSGVVAGGDEKVKSGLDCAKVSTGVLTAPLTGGFWLGFELATLVLFFRDTLSLSGRAILL